MLKKYNYGSAIAAGFDYLLANHPDVFIVGQGLWSPWYVGNSMKDLEKNYGRDRVIDTPVSEAACTGVAVGASLAGMRAISVHPRIDFMLYAFDPIINEAAKWSHMFGGQASSKITIRGIINRGGEQGAQHSQSLHAMFAHVPGLRVVMPACVADARDLLIASVLCDDPVIYIDDRWLYDLEDELPEPEPRRLELEGPKKIKDGNDITIVASGYSVQLVVETLKKMETNGIQAEVIDIRILNPLNPELIIESVKKTGRLLVVDGGWKNVGFAGEVITRATETISPKYFKCSPKRVTLPDAPAPTSSVLEKIYYPSSETIAAIVFEMCKV